MEAVRVTPAVHDAARKFIDDQDLSVPDDVVTVPFHKGLCPQGKVHLLLDWSARPRDIADPWYTHDFEATYRDVREGCESLLDGLTGGGEL